MAGKNKPFNPWALSGDPDLEKLNQLQAKSIADQQNLLRAQQMNIAGTSHFTPQTNLAPLVGLVDQWTGSKLSQGYQAPESGQQRLSKVQALEQGLAAQQNALTDNQLAQLKERLAEKKSDATMIHQDETQRNLFAQQEKLLKMRLDHAAEIAAGKATKLKPLPADKINELADLKHQQENLDSVHTQWKEMTNRHGDDLLNKLLDAGASIIPNTPENTYDSLKLQGGTDFGKAMLGNARSHEMLMTHVGMMPGNWDNIPKGEAKIQNAKALAAEKFNQKIKSYREGGYDTSQYEQIPFQNNHQESQQTNGGDEIHVYQGKKYRLRPGTDPSKQENWEIAQ